MTTLKMRRREACLLGSGSIPSSSGTQQLLGSNISPSPPPPHYIQCIPNTGGLIRTMGDNGPLGKGGRGGGGGVVE